MARRANRGSLAAIEASCLWSVDNETTVKKQDRENVRRILGRVKVSIVERLADGDDKGLATELTAAHELESRLDAEDYFEQLVERTKGKL